VRVLSFVCALALVFALTTAVLGQRAAAASPTTTVYLPNVTRMLGGPTGWQTPFIVQNVGTVPTDLDVSFYQFSDGSLVITRHVSGLAPGTSFADVPNNDSDLPAGGQFSVVIQSFGAPVVSVVNGHQGVGARAEAFSYVGLSQGSTQVSLPYVAKSDGGWLTTFIIQNLGTVPTTASIKVGQSVAGILAWSTITRTIAPGRSAAIDPRGEAAIQAGSNFAQITADQPIAVVADVHNDDASIVNPKAYSYNGIMNAGSSTYVPYIAKNTDGIGRSTKLYIQNAGSAPATPQVELRAQGVAPEPLFAHSPLQPGERNILDVVLSTSSPAGEYAAIVTGGNFAVLSATTSTATALGYTGQSATGAKLFIPNVTRTLGGPAGWSTPLVIQSATATSGTLRWYRFSDGTLAHTQALTFTPGQSVKVDPRQVAALADNTQYAVVIDASGGTVAAVVLEFAEGGANAMAYPGLLPVAGTTPVASGSFDPKAYFKAIPGYTYAPVSPDVLTQLKTPFNSLWGKELVDLDAKYVAQNNVLTAAVIVFAVSPDFANNSSFRQGTLDDFASSPGATRGSILGVPVVYLGREIVYFQGNFLVVVDAISATAANTFTSQLVSANQ
jgi:hypothetical protein